MALQTPQSLLGEGPGAVTVNRAVRPVGGSAVSDLWGQPHLPRPGMLLVQPWQRLLVQDPIIPSLY